MLASNLLTLSPYLQAAIDRLLSGRTALVDRLWADPAFAMRASGREPDSWQVAALHSVSDQQLWVVTRQGGKSLTAACIALVRALLHPNSLILLVSPSDQQSMELFLKVKELYRPFRAEVPPSELNKHEMILSNGSRIVSLPNNEDTIRGFSGVALLIIDEAARVPEALYAAVRPMLAVSQGKLVALSNAWVSRGWFYKAFKEEYDWEKTVVTADQCPRIPKDFLAREARSLGPRWFGCEYLCKFQPLSGAAFDPDDITAAIVPSGLRLLELEDSDG